MLGDGWTSFAREGTPQLPASLWPEYWLGADEALELNTEPSVVQGWRADPCARWAQVATQR